MRFKILKDGLPDPADPRLKQELGNDINEYVQQSLATLMASVMAQARLADKPKLGIRYCIRGQGNRVLPILWWDTGDDNIDDAVDKVFHMNRMNMFFKTSTAENVNKYVMDNYFHGNGRLYSSYITRSQKSYHLKSLPPGRHVQMETGEEAFEDVKYQVPVGIKETDMKGYTANFLDHVSTNCNSNVIFDQVFVFRKNNDAMEKGIYKRISHMEYNLKTLPETKDVLPQWYEQVRDKLDDYSRDIIDFIEENMVQVFVNAYCSQRHTADAFAATFAGHVCNGTELVVFTDEVNLENPDSINELLTFNWYKPVETENGLGYMYPYHVAGALFTLPFIEERYLPAFGSTSDRSMRDTSTGVGNSVITAEDRDRKRIIELKSSSLTQHLFICGGTGSGKTYTMRSLLKNLYGNEKINFLVIEPVKSEYRLLKEMDESLKNDLLFLTPGDETLFPMRLNILEPIIPDRPLIS
ncbi:MAG: helicase HerA domain-containing protein, partial [Spirochaetota bacterium]